MYNDIADTSKKLYNGNISQTSWNTLNTDSSIKTYTYTYDALNRITSAVDNTTNYNLTSVAYDKNGNITALNRKGHLNSGATSFGVMDNLVYTYDSGNKLKKVLDNGNDNYGFKDGANLTTEYSYDVNGNMKTDANKGITSILYNHLNLPTEIKFDNNNSKKINYTYDAVGIKLRKVTNDNGSITTTDYTDNGSVYENNVLQFIPTAEGYVTPDGSGGFDYVYQYLDHLGSIRLSYTDADGNGTIAQSEIIEENNYYAFGLKHKGYNTNVSPNGNSTAQKFKYNGIELEESLELNLYEMEFRQYDPAIARFTSIDPVTHHSMSTYVAFDNNPIYWADPSGADAQSLIDEILRKSTGEETTWTNNNDGTFSGSNGQTADCDDCPKEGETKKVTRVLSKRGNTTTDTQYYHSGGFEGSTPGWKSEREYTEIITSIAGFLSSMDRGFFASKGSIEWLSNVQAVDGLAGLLLNYSAILTQRVVARERARTIGNTSPMGFDSPFFIVGGLANVMRSFTIKGGLAKSLRPLGLGSTGRFAATNLTEQLAMAEIMSNPSMGRVIMGGRTMSDSRWVGWKKMSWNNGGVEIHYLGKFKNGILKAVDDFKFK